MKTAFIYSLVCPLARADAKAKAIASRTPRVRKLISKSSQRRWKDAAFREQTSAAIKEGVKTAWSDPVKAAERRAKIRATWDAKTLLQDAPS